MTAMMYPPYSTQKNGNVISGVVGDDHHDVYPVFYKKGWQHDIRLYLVVQSHLTFPMNCRRYNYKTFFPQFTDVPMTPDNEPQVALLDDSVSWSDMDVNDVDGLGWLNEELPNLSTVSHYSFDLEQEFDIRRYLDILADNASGSGPSQAVGPASIGSMPTSMVDKSCNASTVAPEASAWDT
jgi:hypothetical protein